MMQPGSVKSPHVHEQPSSQKLESPTGGGSEILQSLSSAQHNLNGSQRKPAGGRVARGPGPEPPDRSWELPEAARELPPGAPRPGQGAIGTGPGATRLPPGFRDDPLNNGPSENRLKVVHSENPGSAESQPNKFEHDSKT